MTWKAWHRSTDGWKSLAPRPKAWHLGVAPRGRAAASEEIWYRHQGFGPQAWHLRVTGLIARTIGQDTERVLEQQNLLSFEGCSWNYPPLLRGIHALRRLFHLLLNLSARTLKARDGPNVHRTKWLKIGLRIVGGSLKCPAKWTAGLQGGKAGDNKGLWEAPFSVRV